jgi:dTDP-4-amino-4,6-dideoxygalactose transaminase/CelD/BcsL family acetyltransferase involved in cellulose biosynthesis
MMRSPRLGILPPLSPGLYARREAGEPPFPLGEGSTFFARGRHALWQGVQALGLSPGDELLVPAYHAGPDIEALSRAGLRCRFYESGEHLHPDEAELEALLDPSVRALYLIHYLGFPQDVARWRSWCDRKGLLLLEDAAQAWLASADSGPVGSLGDLSLFCPYKALGLPDGAVLRVRAPSPMPESQRGLGLALVVGGHVRWLTQRSGAAAVLGARLREPAENLAPNGFALGDPGSPPTEASLFLLRRLAADPDHARRRRANYRLLLDDLRERVPPPFDTLPDGASPFAFPIETDAKADLLEQLTRAGVEALDLWPTPHPLLPAGSFPAAARLRARTVVLPVHQGLRPGDIARIAAVVGRPKHARRPLRVEPVGSLDELRDAWVELAERSRNVFSTWEWASTWWRHFGGERGLLGNLCRSDRGQPIAILPLYGWSSHPLRVLRFIGHGPADELGPVCAPSDHVAAARALRSVLAETRWDIFLGERLGGEGWGALLGAKTLRRESSPVLKLDGVGVEELEASWSSKLRKQLRYDQRRLERDHGMRFRLADDRDRLDADLDTLFRLHTARWGRGGSSFSIREAFHREFAVQAFERGWLRLWFLEADGKPVSVWYGFRFSGVESHYQGGRDPAWGRSSVGSVLLAHTIRAAAADGMQEYRFLRGGESFKYRFATGDPGIETVGIGRGPLGRAALEASSLLPEAVVPAIRRLAA